MKRMLVILPYVPFPIRRGTFQRVYHLTEHLAGVYDVDLFCLSSEAEDAQHKDRFAGFCGRVEFCQFQHPPWPSFWTDRVWNLTPTTIRHWWSDAVNEALGDFIAGQEYDIVYWVDIVLWPYIDAHFCGHGQLIMDRSRVDWLFQQEELATLPDTMWGKFMRRENLWKMSQVERHVMEAIDLEVVCGVEDKEFLDERLSLPDKVFVLPNGANTDFFSADDWPPQPTAFPSALFCGALDYTPNTDAMRWYFDEIHERILKGLPDYRLILVGKNPTDEVMAYAARPGVQFAGEVPDVRPYYQKAWMQVVPLRIGGGTRLKIVEGLSMGNPVVSTTLGAQGLDFAPDQDITLADSAEAFANACLQLAGNAELRHSQAKAGRRKVLNAYTWRALGARLVEKLNALQPVS
ncbi:glycosyltransferase family 4 protein [Cerasicoccus frondis]|uniref:glycosyltransferase family 4 protein n=1 Tax=Cerasicoccus frondis TaxID=490090 RepID=UPI002852A3C2|nr:glycosyltransferase family 4 protein [Cerasicoccus frondis]